MPVKVSQRLKHLLKALTENGEFVLTAAIPAIWLFLDHAMTFVKTSPSTVGIPIVLRQDKHTTK